VTTELAFGGNVLGKFGIIIVHFWDDVHCPFVQAPGGGGE